MKSKYKEENVSSIYPKLMIEDREGIEALIILFTKSGEGTVVYSENEDYPVGKHSDTWTNPYFRDFTGEITLSN